MTDIPPTAKLRRALFQALAMCPEPQSATGLAAFAKGYLGRPVTAAEVRAELRRWDVVESRVGRGSSYYAIRNDE